MSTEESRLEIHRFVHSNGTEWGYVWYACPQWVDRRIVKALECLCAELDRGEQNSRSEEAEV